MKEITIGKNNPLTDKLLSYGFFNNKDALELKRNIMDGELCVHLNYIDENRFTLCVYDVVTDEEYVLHNVASAKGEYVGRVRTEIESLVLDIQDKCFDSNPFKQSLVFEITDYVYSSYGSRPEFLWDSDPSCAVFRRADTGKWFGVLMRVPLSKFGFDSNEIVEIMNLHVKSEEIDLIVDKKQIFHAFHMNKRHWISVILDDGADFEYTKKLIDNSFLLALKK